MIFKMLLMLSLLTLVACSGAPENHILLADLKKVHGFDQTNFEYAVGSVSRNKDAEKLEGSEFAAMKCKIFNIEIKASSKDEILARFRNGIYIVQSSGGFFGIGGSDATFITPTDRSEMIVNAVKRKAKRGECVKAGFFGCAEYEMIELAGEEKDAAEKEESKKIDEKYSIKLAKGEVIKDIFNASYCEHSGALTHAKSRLTR
jgi:hypothetical protein